MKWWANVFHFNFGCRTQILEIHWICGYLIMHGICMPLLPLDSTFFFRQRLTARELANWPPSSPTIPARHRGLPLP